MGIGPDGELRDGLPHMRDPSFIVVLSGPAGVGKSSCWGKLRELMPELVYSVSTTTRPIREGEREGMDYNFVSDEEFGGMVAGGAFVEWAEVHGHRYGTPAAFLEEALQEGKTVFLEVDVQGGERLLDVYPEGVYVFLLPPRFEVLEERLRKRGTEDDSAVLSRLQRAKDEMAHANLDRYTYEVVNDDLDDAVEKLRCIIVAERCRRFRRRAVKGR